MSILFKKVLVANRGECAIRIIKALRSMGITSVVIYEKDEENELFVKLSDQSIVLETSKSSIYLDIDLIIKTAKDENIDGIHPGWGFMSENYNFSKLCEDSGIVFIGPSYFSMKKKENKVGVKEIANGLGVPVILGESDILRFGNFIEQNGLPVLIKASYGGGGKGIKMVDSRNKIDEIIKNAQVESLNSFGRNDVYIEKYIPNARHIEFQIIGDIFGNVIHLGERECSVQRNNQKIIEETPSTTLTAKMRAQMGDCAIKIAKALKYTGAGTVEFLVSGESFYFMEMNTRLQVEHQITELVTGIDIVKEQINIAQGIKLSVKQNEIKISGHSLECRINAESVHKNFAPSVGILKNMYIPEKRGVIVSSGVTRGSHISPKYDSMIAKLIVYSSSRDKAIDLAYQTLGGTSILGIDTNLSLLKTILLDAEFKRGEYNINFLSDRRIVEKTSQLSEDDVDSIIYVVINKYYPRKIYFSKENTKEWKKYNSDKVVKAEFC